MKNTIKTIALSVSFLSGAGMTYAQTDTNVEVDTGLQASLDAISQQVENGSALNLAVNTGDINASVDVESYADLGVDTQEVVNTVDNTIETTAIGAANTGSIDIAQGSLNKITTEITSDISESQTDDFYDFSDGVNQIEESADVSTTLNTTIDTDFSEEINETLSNYSVANIAYNSGAIDASVSTITEGVGNSVTNDIITTAIGAVNTGSITVTVGE